MRFINRTGHRYGHLAVTHRAGRRGVKVLWACRCDCGAKHEATGSDLASGRTLSCGCVKTAAIRSRNTIHGHTPRRLRTAEYRAWANMRTRCTDPACDYYDSYGGRGITVCDRWRTFANFISDMGLRPSTSHTLDRINNDGHYEPDNCRWATPAQQANNKRTSVRWEYKGQRLTVSEIAAIAGVKYMPLWWRLNKLRLSVHEAIAHIRLTKRR